MTSYYVGMLDFLHKVEFIKGFVFLLVRHMLHVDLLDHVNPAIYLPCHTGHDTETPATKLLIKPVVRQSRLALLIAHIYLS